MSKIINFFGAPSSGKSLRASQTYNSLKEHGVNAELTREFAKDKVYEKNTTAIACEPYIMGCELYNLERLQRSGVDFISTDCPLLIPAFYNKTRSKTFELFALELFNSFDNVNFFLTINKNNFKEEGRIHNLEESLAIEKKMLNFLGYYDIKYVYLDYEEKPTIEYLNRYMKI